MGDRILATIEIEETDDGFFYVIEGEPPVGPYEDEEAATKAAVEFLQGAMTRLVQQTLGV